MVVKSSPPSPFPPTSQNSAATSSKKCTKLHELAGSSSQDTVITYLREHYFGIHALMEALKTSNSIQVVEILSKSDNLVPLLTVLGNENKFNFSDGAVSILKRAFEALPTSIDTKIVKTFMSSSSNSVVRLKAILFQLQPSTESNYFYNELIIEVLNQLSYSILTNNTLTQHEQNAWVTIISFPEINETLQKSAIDLINKTNFSQANVLAHSEAIKTIQCAFLNKKLEALAQAVKTSDSKFIDDHIDFILKFTCFTEFINSNYPLQIKALLFQLQPSIESNFFYNELIIEVLKQLSYSILTNNTHTQFEQNAWVTIISFPKINETLQSAAIDLINKTNFTQATTLAQSEDEHHIVALQVSEQKTRPKTQKYLLTLTQFDTLIARCRLHFPQSRQPSRLSSSSWAATRSSPPLWSTNPPPASLWRPPTTRPSWTTRWTTSAIAKSTTLPPSRNLPSVNPSLTLA